DDDLPGQDLDVAEVVEADERVASEVFAHFDRFEQETGSVLLELEEGGDRRLEIRGDLAHGGLQFQLDRGHSASVRLGGNKKTRRVRGGFSRISGRRIAADPRQRGQYPKY